jgi:hypothetical protein
LFCAGLQKNLGTFLDRCPGRKHVVHQENVFLPDFFLLADLEGAAKIFSAFRSGKFNLGGRHTDSLQSEEINGDRVAAADLPGQKESLIETPLTETARMERDGNQKIRLGPAELGVLAIGHEIPQRNRQMGGPAVFESGDHFRGPPFIKPDGSRPRKKPVFRQTTRTKMILSRRYKWNPAPRAKRMGDHWNLLLTGGAGQIRPLIFWNLTAKGTFRGEEKIDQGMAEGAEFHVRAGKL